MPDSRFEPGPGEDPCAVFFKGFSSVVKADEVSKYFSNKGYSNRISYQKIYPNYYRLFMALRFETAEVAKEVCQKFSDNILFGYKVHLSFFKTHLARINNFFMQDKVRKLRAQAMRRPFSFRPKFYSPGRNFTYRFQRRSRSSSSESDGSNSPNRKRRTRSRETSGSKRRRHRSHSRSSRSRSRSQTPTRASPCSTVSKYSTSSVESKSDKSRFHSSSRRLCSQVTVMVQNHPKKSKDNSNSSKETSSSRVRKESNPPVTEKQKVQTPNKDELLSNFSPVSLCSDDEAVLKTPTPGHAAVRSSDMQTGTNRKTPVHQLTTSYFTPKKTAPPTEVWITSEGDSTPEGGTPSPRGHSLSPKGPNLAHKPNHGVYNRVGSYTEIKAANCPWQLKPLAVQSESNRHVNPSTLSNSPRGQNGAATPSTNVTPASIRTVQTNNRVDTIQVSPPNGTRSQIHPSLTSSFGASPPLNGVANGKLQQTKLETLQAKKEEIIKAYKQDCDTFATVVRMLIRKDPELETRLQAALHENLKEIGQRCIQELQDVMEQI